MGKGKERRKEGKKKASWKEIPKNLLFMPRSRKEWWPLEPVTPFWTSQPLPAEQGNNAAPLERVLYEIAGPGSMCGKLIETLPTGAYTGRCLSVAMEACPRPRPLRLADVPTGPQAWHRAQGTGGIAGHCPPTNRCLLSRQHGSIPLRLQGISGTFELRISIPAARRGATSSMLMKQCLCV